MKGQNWFVYIIENQKGYFYTGITTDLERRFSEHANSKKGAKFFNFGKPLVIKFKKKFSDRSSALKFEYYIKSLTRAKKSKLISAYEVSKND